MKFPHHPHHSFAGSTLLQLLYAYFRNRPFKPLWLQRHLFPHTYKIVFLIQYVLIIEFCRALILILLAILYHQDIFCEAYSVLFCIITQHLLSATWRFRVRINMTVLPSVRAALVLKGTCGIFHLRQTHKMKVHLIFYIINS